MTTTTHRAATLAAIAADIRRCTTPTRDARQRPPVYDRLLRLASRAHNHRLHGRERAAQACKRMALKIIDGMEE